MTNFVSASDETAKNATDFYNTYLSVIYGLLATQGLTSVVNFTNKDDENGWTVVSILLFGGTFIAAMRLWLSFANIDGVTRRSYGVVGPHHSWFNLLLLIDTVFATAFAGLLLAMFSAIPSETSLFQLFLWLSGLTLVYDLVSALFFYGFTKQVGVGAGDHEVLCEYKATKISGWIKQDLVFVAAVTALYIVDTSLHLGSSITLASTFVLLSAVFSVVELFPHWVDMIRKFLRGSGVQA